MNAEDAAKFIFDLSARLGFEDSGSHLELLEEKPSLEEFCISYTFLSLNEEIRGDEIMGLREAYQVILKHHSLVG